jgi:hypothetical protein
MSERLNEIRGGNFSHSGKAELYPEFVLCDMGPFEEWCESVGWMPIAMLLLAGNSP